MAGIAPCAEHLQVPPLVELVHSFSVHLSTPVIQNHKAVADRGPTVDHISLA